jgi:hypothetical protein
MGILKMIFWSLFGPFLIWLALVGHIVYQVRKFPFSHFCPLSFIRRGSVVPLLAGFCYIQTGSNILCVLTWHYYYNFSTLSLEHLNLSPTAYLVLHSLVTRT